MRDGRWEYTIRAYRPFNQGGSLLLETTHANAASRDTELEVLRARKARNEIGMIEIISHVTPFALHQFD